MYVLMIRRETLRQSSRIPPMWKFISVLALLSVHQLPLRFYTVYMPIIFYSRDLSSNPRSYQSHFNSSPDGLEFKG